MNSNDLNVQLICIGHRQHSQFAQFGGWMVAVGCAHNGITISERAFDILCMQSHKNEDKKKLRCSFAPVELDCFCLRIFRFEFLEHLLRELCHKWFLNWIIFIVYHHFIQLNQHSSNRVNPFFLFSVFNCFFFLFHCRINQLAIGFVCSF